MTRAKPRPPAKQAADYIFQELTRSICPTCKIVIDAQVLLRAGKVYMRKRCPEHGWFEGLVSADADSYVAGARFNKPGTLPLEFSTEVRDGCPLDCGLCTEHKQHTCVALIEVNSGCNLDCPICFANAEPAFDLTLAEVEFMLDRYVALEGEPEVVQFSGGEPTIHPRILEMVAAAQARGIPNVMINTNGLRIATDDDFVAELARLRPTIYFQFDGFDRATNQRIRGADLLKVKLKALDRLAAIDLDVALVAAIERDVNEREVGAIVRFGLEHPAVRGVVFQPVTHVGRHIDFDPMQRMTIPDVLGAIVDQSEGKLVGSDFVPVPCCFPSCQVNTYLYVDGDEILPLPRVLEVDEYLDYITNRTFPALPDEREVRGALEGLWSAGAVPGSDAATDKFQCACGPGYGLPEDLNHLRKHVFQIAIKDFMDAYTFNVKHVMKCCVGVLVPDGRMIPFCAFNSVGYRDEVRSALASREVKA
jgi:hypothetical protein